MVYGVRLTWLSLLTVANIVWHINGEALPWDLALFTVVMGWWLARFIALMAQLEQERFRQRAAEVLTDFRNNVLSEKDIKEQPTR